MLKKFAKNWWKWLRFDPSDPRFNAGGAIKIAVIGGGTGLSNLLRGLKKYSDQITAIVAVTDDGASSGEIRAEYDMLPPGDIRKCISALAYDEELVGKVFEYRFKKRLFGGHTLGNIWITAMTEIAGSFEKSIEATSSIFQTAGKVLPATLNKIDLVADFTDGTAMRGESKFVKAGKIIRKVYLSEKGVRAYAKATKAIKEADLIIIGPGSLYTSIMPNLLISGLRNALKASSSVKIYIANCSTERGETENYTVEDHIRALESHAGANIFDYALVNSRVLRRSIKSDKLGEVYNITTKQKEVGRIKIVRADLVDQKNPLYHDPNKLAKKVIGLYNEIKH
ncbi:MAG: gluconeogenesis factor YvcK family protein [Patescibacteria group bacterium]|jgi:uncharacterized cofD-like protein